jgi:DNA-binding CsgD family transcriptional regulator
MGRDQPMASDGDRVDRVSELVGRVYDAALDEKLWAGLAPGIAATFNSTGAVVVSMGGGSASYLSSTPNHEEASRREYEQYYHKVDVWAEGGAKRGLGQVFVGQEILSDREFRKTEIYQDFCRKIDVFHMIGSVLPIGGDEIAAVGIHRPREGVAFTGRDRRLVAQFLPHLKRALQIRRRLIDPSIERLAAQDALERSGTAILIASRDGRLLYANHTADDLLRARAGGGAIGGRLVASHRTATDRLTALIHGAADMAAGRGPSAGGAMAIEREDRLPLTVLVAPFRPAHNGFGAAIPAAIIFIRDPESPTPAMLTLQGLFGLTVAEAAIASMLAQGRSVEDIAARQRVAVNTVRVHLKSAFAKTHTSRQAQLVALILSSVASMSAG